MQIHTIKHTSNSFQLCLCMRQFPFLLHQTLPLQWAIRATALHWVLLLEVQLLLLKAKRLLKGLAIQ